MADTGGGAGPDTADPGNGRLGSLSRSAEMRPATILSTRIAHGKY